MAEIYRVLILFDTSQSVLSGIADYTSKFASWEFYHQMPYYREQLDFRKSLKRIRDFHPDGIIAHLHNKHELHELVRKNTPAVISLHSGETVKGMTNLVSIISDDDKIGEIAAEYFAKKGYTKFAYCGYEVSIHWSVARQKGFCKQLERKKYAADVYEMPSTRLTRLWENEKKIMVDWLKSLKKPVAILSCNDDRGRDILEACRIAGIAVPEEVAVLGVGNHEITCELDHIPLSSICTNREKAGFEAAKILDQMMKGEKIDQDSICIEPTGVIERQSTDILAIEDTLVAQALQCIRKKDRMMQVNDIAEECGVSRRNLERRFRTVLHCSINQEITRVKAEQISKLLINTQMPISKIATVLGYESLDYLSRFFRGRIGMSPKAYRKKMTQNI